jgi:hypothetical protein
MGPQSTRKRVWILAIRTPSRNQAMESETGLSTLLETRPFQELVVLRGTSEKLPKSGWCSFVGILVLWSEPQHFSKIFNPENHAEKSRQTEYENKNPISRSKGVHASHKTKEPNCDE